MTAIGRSLLLLLLNCTGCAQSHRPVLFLSPVAVAATGEIAAAFEDGIYVDDVVNMPARISHYVTQVVSSAEYNEALRFTLERESLLSPNLESAAYRLTPTYVDVMSPFKIGLDNEGFATFRYRLVRLSDGLTLFDEEVQTRFESKGSLSNLFVPVIIGAGSGALTTVKGKSVTEAIDKGESKFLSQAEKRERKTFEKTFKARLAISAPGPSDASLRVVLAMQRAVALNITMSLRQMLNPETATR